MTAKERDFQNEVICKANLITFKAKIKQLRYLIDDDRDLELAVIESCVEMLVEHGKNRDLIRNISQISSILARSLGLGKTYCKTLEQAARIYDIGNLLVYSDIYMKDEALNFDEFNIIKNHTLWGYNLLISQHLLTTDIAAVISAEHHEWWNGGGYPKGFKGEKIDIGARIVSLADSVSALFIKRPGREPWSYDRIVKYVEARSQIEFDPAVVKVFMENKDLIHEVLKGKIASENDR